MKPETREHLIKCYHKSRAYQEKNGVQFELTVEEYLRLWPSKMIQKIEYYTEKGIQSRFWNDDDMRPVLTWKKTYRERLVMNVETARIVRADTSRMDGRLQPGEKHKPESIQKISDSMKGHLVTDETRGKISEKLTGTTNSEFTRNAKSEAAKKRWAREREAKEASND